MDDTTLEQRIKYLVEHGGVWDDPIGDLRRQIRTLYWVTGLALVLHALIDFVR